MLQKPILIGLCLKPDCPKQPKLLDEIDQFKDHEDCQPISLEDL